MRTCATAACVACLVVCVSWLEEKQLCAVILPMDQRRTFELIEDFQALFRVAVLEQRLHNAGRVALEDNLPQEARGTGEGG